jgi:hypothetical protein
MVAGQETLIARIQADLIGERLLPNICTEFSVSGFSPRLR